MNRNIFLYLFNWKGKFKTVSKILLYLYKNKYEVDSSKRLSPWINHLTLLKMLKIITKK